MKSMHIIVLIIFSIFTTSILANSCQTQQSGNWSDQSTWTACGGMIPQDDDSVVIKTGDSVLLDQNTSALDAMIVETGGDFNVGAPGFILNANTAGADIDLSNATILLEGDLVIIAQAHNIFMGEVDGNFALTLDSQGETRLIGTIGGNMALSALTTDAAGTTVFANVNGSVAVGTIIVDGDRTFNDSVTLAEHATIEGNGGVITFSKTLNSETSTDKDFTINNAANTIISFNDKVGAINRLKKLQIINSSNASTIFNTAEILTTRNQRWGTDILLNSPTNNVLFNVSIGGTVKIGSSSNDTVRSQNNGVQSLTIQSSSVVSVLSTVGDNNQSLNNFTIDSASTAELHPNNITVTGTQSYTGAINLNSNLVLTADVIDMQGDVDNAGFDLTFNTTDLTGLTILNGVLSGTGDFIKDGIGHAYFTQISSITGDFTINQGGFYNNTAFESVFPNVSTFNLIDGAAPYLGSNITSIFNLANGQTLSGDGACYCNLSAQSGSIITPAGPTTGSLTAQSYIDMFTGSILEININGTSNGDYDVLASFGNINLDSDSLGGASLNVTLGNVFVPNLGDVFIIVKAIFSNTPIFGNFNGLPEGSVVDVGGILFTISYSSNSGKVITLTALGSSTLYVNADAAAGGNGQSWATAFNNLQDALAIAVSGMEIWVAQGVYYPDVGSSQISDDRSASFTLIDGISIYGGFNGTETNSGDRDPDTNTTILSGDITQDDANDDNNFIAETPSDIVNGNSYHIVNAQGIDTNTVFDGFTITAGNADNSDGAGIYCSIYDNGPSLNQMQFIGNKANYNGAAQHGCAKSIQNSLYENNESGFSGGAIFTYGGTIINSVFLNNKASEQGGAIHSEENTLIVKNSEFISNSASESGGAIGASGDAIKLINTLFLGNRASGTGGDFTGGGGIFLSDVDATLINVTMTGNRSNSTGGAIDTYNNVGLSIRNSIIYKNKDGSNSLTESVFIHNDAYMNNSYSLIKGYGTTGTANLDENPLFITNTNPNSAPTSSGNARLQLNSPAINAGKNNFVSLTTDLDGLDRIRDTTVDMGAYEFSNNSISITVTGLDAGTLVLQNNGADDLTFNNDGTQTFSLASTNTVDYSVTVFNQPTSPSQNCVVTDGSGTINGTDVFIDVACTIIQYNVGVDVSGLVNGNSVILDNNGEGLTITTDGQFNFATALDDGSAYDVTVTTHPTIPNQVCSVIAGSANLNGAGVFLTVTCTITQYNIGVDVSGLVNGNSVTLDNNGESLIVATDGQFNFATALDDGSAYDVTVTTHPTTPNQMCSVVAGSDNLNGTDILLTLTCTTNQYFIGGITSGLVTGNSVVLGLGSENLEISGNTPFVFNNSLNDGSNYSITVAINPTVPNQTCILANASGTITGDDIIDVTVNCSTNTYSIGGIVTGLFMDNNLILQNNSGEIIAITESGFFEFSNQVEDLQAFSVTIFNQPSNPIQPCTISNNSGNVSGTDVTTLSVVCEFGDDLIYKGGFE